MWYKSLITSHFHSKLPACLSLILGLLFALCVCLAQHSWSWKHFFISLFFWHWYAYGAYCAAMSHSVASLIIKPILLCYAFSTVYDISLNRLPMADLSGSITPVWCEVCLKKGDTNKAHTYCTICTKCYCEKHSEVGFTYEIMLGGIQWLKHPNGV